MVQNGHFAIVKFSVIKGFKPGGADYFSCDVKEKRKRKSLIRLRILFVTKILLFFL